MDNTFEEQKTELHNCEEILSVKNNSVVKTCFSVIKSSFPFWGELVNGLWDDLLIKNINEKRSKLLDVILSESEFITTDKSNDIEFLIGLRKTVEVVDRLSTNDKIEYFGNLIRNGYLKSEKIESYKFEEYFNAISNLSHRQLSLLSILYKYSKKIIDSTDGKDIEIKRWDIYKEDVCEKFSLSEQELVAILKSAEKSGLCKEVVGGIYGYKGGRFESTPLLDDFVTFAISKTVN